MCYILYVFILCIYVFILYVCVTHSCPHSLSFNVLIIKNITKWQKNNFSREMASGCLLTVNE
jgi:hypothetical protein